jgi:transposase-like protein
MELRVPPYQRPRRNHGVIVGSAKRVSNYACHAVGCGARSRRMNRSSALRLLPTAYARVLVLADQGLAPVDLARRLGIDASAVGPLLRIARTKLAALQALPEETSDHGQA